MQFPKTASGLKTATTTVSIASATAPTTWQVLTAISPTNATWQTPSWWSNPIFETQIAWEQTTWLIARFTVKGSQTLALVKISLATLPTWADFKVDVRRNWTATTNSIFTSDTPISITTWQSATNWIYTSTSTSIDNGTCAENDILYFYVVQVWSTLSWTWLEVICY